jgi:SGNH domain (fused to AT3 domains)
MAMSKHLTRRVRRTMAVLATVAVATFSAATSATATSAHVATPPAPSTASIQAALHAALGQSSLPGNLNPSLGATLANEYAVGGAAYASAACSPYGNLAEAAHPVPCYYGNLKATKNIVIFGDSFALNWIPALDLFGKTYGYKVAMFSFSGCVAAFVPSGPAGPGFDQAHVNACDLFHRTLPAAVRPLHPVAIIVGNGTPSLGTATDTKWLTGLKAAYDQMSTPTNHPIRVFMGSSPHLSYMGPSCLASHPGAISSCSMKYLTSTTGAWYYAGSLIRDQRAATIAGANVIPTVQWFCYQTRCPLVVSNKLVYIDADHLSIVYSLYLSTVFAQVLNVILHP